MSIGARKKETRNGDPGIYFIFVDCRCNFFFIALRLETTIIVLLCAIRGTLLHSRERARSFIVERSRQSHRFESVYASSTAWNFLIWRIKSSSTHLRFCAIKRRQKQRKEPYLMCGMRNIARAPVIILSAISII